MRAALARKMAVNCDQPGAIGDPSGEEGGRYSRRAPTDASAAFTPSPCGEDSCSIHTPGPACQVGTRRVWTSVKHTWASVLPAPVIAAMIPWSESAPKTVMCFPVWRGVEVGPR